MDNRVKEFVSKIKKAKAISTQVLRGAKAFEKEGKKFIREHEDDYEKDPIEYINGSLISVPAYHAMSRAADTFEAVRSGELYYNW